MVALIHELGSVQAGIPPRLRVVVFGLLSSSSGPFSDISERYPTCRLVSRLTLEGDSEQVVGVSDQTGMHLSPIAPVVASLASPPTVFLQSRTPLRSACVPIDRPRCRDGRLSAAVRRRFACLPCVLRHIRCDVETPAEGNEVAGVATLLASQDNSARAGPVFIGHRNCDTPLSPAIDRLDLKVNQNGAAFSHHRV
jgi:hypothetical protein